MATTTTDTISATTIVEAPPAEVFAFLRDPANHPLISGDGSVRRSRSGSRQLVKGDRFGMDMKIVLPYVVPNRVHEFEQDRRIAWANPGGQRWRWELAPTEDGRTQVTETFVVSTALPGYRQVLRLLGFPARHERNVERSVARLAGQFPGA